MLSFAGNLKVWVALEPCDLRKGFDGLSALVAQKLQQELRSGALFVFTNRARTRLKLLYWDGSGLWLACKRLEEGRFEWPRAAQPGATRLCLRPEALALLLDGVRLTRAGLQPWYGRAE